jgi:hypothetical protein
MGNINSALSAIVVIRLEGILPITMLCIWIHKMLLDTFRADFLCFAMISLEMCISTRAEGVDTSSGFLIISCLNRCRSFFIFFSVTYFVCILQQNVHMCSNSNKLVCIFFRNWRQRTPPDNNINSKLACHSILRKILHYLKYTKEVNMKTK